MHPAVRMRDTSTLPWSRQASFTGAHWDPWPGSVKPLYKSLRRIFSKTLTFGDAGIFCRVSGLSGWDIIYAKSNSKEFLFWKYRFSSKIHKDRRLQSWRLEKTTKFPKPWIFYRKSYSKFDAFWGLSITLVEIHGTRPLLLVRSTKKLIFSISPLWSRWRPPGQSESFCMASPVTTDTQRHCQTPTSAGDTSI